APKSSRERTDRFGTNDVECMGSRCGEQAVVGQDSARQGEDTGAASVSAKAWRRKRSLVPPAQSARGKLSQGARAPVLVPMAKTYEPPFDYRDARRSAEIRVGSQASPGLYAFWARSSAAMSARSCGLPVARLLRMRSSRL